jgi:ketosteroid isomerase-like protein
VSEENVKVVRYCWAAWIRGDLDAAFANFAPDVEWDTTTYEGWPETGVYRGHDGVRRFLDEWLAIWDRYEAGVDDYLDAGDNQVVALAWQRGHGHESHALVEMQFAMVFTLRDGLVTRMDVYSDRARALESTGVRV